ncbi:MAG: hypothetical protein ACRELY_12040 [Polyangiaceae bacterium]
MERLRLAIASSFYDMGQVLAEILDSKLYAALGYASFEALLEDRELMGARQARKFIDVANAFRREPAVRLGPEKAYALIRYCARTEKDDEPVSFVHAGFPIGGKRKDIDVITVREIEAATRTAIGRQKSSHGQSERARVEVESERRAVLVALHKRGIEDAHVSVKWARSSWHLVVEVPAEHARAIFKA